MQFSDILRVGGGSTGGGGFGGPVGGGGFGGGHDDFNFNIDDDSQTGSLASYSLGGGGMSMAAGSSRFVIMGDSDLDLDACGSDLCPTSLQAVLPFGNSSSSSDESSRRFGALYKEEKAQFRRHIVSREAEDEQEDKDDVDDHRADDDSVSISSAENDSDDDDISISSAGDDEDPILGDMNPCSARVRAIERIKTRVNYRGPLQKKNDSTTHSASTGGKNDWSSMPLASPHPSSRIEESVSSESESPKGVQEFPDGSSNQEDLITKQVENGMIFSP